MQMGRLLGATTGTIMAIADPLAGAPPARPSRPVVGEGHATLAVLVASAKSLRKLRRLDPMLA